MRLRLGIATLLVISVVYGLTTMNSEDIIPYETLSEEEREELEKKATAWRVKNRVELNEEEIAVYRSVLSLWHERGDIPNGTVIESQLNAGWLEYVDGELIDNIEHHETVSSEMADDYWEARKLPACLGQDDVEEPFVVRGEDYCKTGNNRPPKLDLELVQKIGVVYSFSRIGFNGTRDQSVLAYGYYCGPLCAAGGIVTLSKVTGEWVVNGVYMEWIS